MVLSSVEIIDNATVELTTVEATTQDTFMEEVQTYLTFKIATFIADYWFPVLVPIGLVGNTLSFLVMIKPNNRKMSTCIYMAAISINDNLMMCLALYNYLLTTVKIYNMHPAECNMMAFLILLLLQNTTFQVLVMTIDKFLAIKWPHKAATYSTPKRAKILSVCVSVCVIMYNIPHVFISKLIGGQCFAYAVGGVGTKVYSWTSFVLNGIIPFALLIYMNYVIVTTVRKSRKLFGTKDTNSTHTGKTQESNKGMETRQKAMKSAESQLTIMLLLVTTLFLILLFPTYARFIYTTFVQSDTPAKFASSMLFYHVSFKLYMTNNGVNFFLYCISGKKFRTDLKEILFCSKERRHASYMKGDDLQSNSTSLSTIS